MQDEFDRIIENAIGHKNYDQILGITNIEAVSYFGQEKTPFNDMFNANVFIHQHKDILRFCDPFGGWFFYNGKTWEADATNLIGKLQEETYKTMLKETPSWIPAYIDEDEEKELKKIKLDLIKSWKAHIKETGGGYRLDQMARISTKDLSVKPSVFDADPYKICIENGVFDLKEFKLLNFSPEHYFTKQANFSYEPSAVCPNWDRFLRIIFLNDENIIRYVQKVIGYSLTADISRQMFFIMQGDGANGKSTFLETILHGFGDYAGKLSSQSIIKKKDGDIPNDWAALVNKRFVVVSELDQHRELDIGIVKQFTTTSPMRVRFLHKEFFDMNPTFKVFLETNPLPRVKGQDDGTWRRIKKIVFSHKFEESEKIINYKEEVLLKELPGIFNWALAGLRDLKENGIQEPEIVKVSNSDYKSNENPLVDFVNECCVKENDVYTLASELWDYYKSYMLSKNDLQYCIGKHSFPDMMLGCGFKRIELTSRGVHQSQKVYLGIKCTKEIMPRNNWESKITPPKKQSQR
jgi:putative DNA primase/helicase